MSSTGSRLSRTVAALAAASLSLAAASPAFAQVFERKDLTLEGARTAIAAAEAEARKSHAGGVIAVVDAGGNLMALERLDDTFAAGANISIGKARTAALFKRPSKFFEDVIKNGRTSMVALSDFTPLQGGVPITVEGRVVGAVGVSGAASAQQDEELATAGAAAVTASLTEASRSDETIFLNAERVAAGFAKGEPLLENGSFKIHASRREGPGKAEVHDRDADLVYVLQGTASLVTGGSVVNGKSIGPDETRGDAIEGGQTRKLAKGDVLVVPAGTPHWFKEVKAPFTYYVVKVTR